jgi:hypothetical protein
MDQCFFLRNPATHTLIHLLNAPKLGCPIVLASCYKEYSVCFKLIGALPLALCMSGEFSLSASASNSSSEIFDNRGNPQSVQHLCCAVPQPAEIVPFRG